MPREIVHWEILEGTSTWLEANGFASIDALLKEHWAFAYLGALLPDVPYYLRGGSTTFEHAAEQLHGSQGEDTFDIPRALTGYILAELDQADRQELWAFLFGLLSHCIVDANFHPLIFYLTGDYYDPDKVKCRLARRRHRLFEVYLDRWWEKKYPGVVTHSIGEVLNQIGKKEVRLSELLTKVVSAGSGPGIDAAFLWRASFRDIAQAQRVFFSPIAGAFVRILQKCIPALGPIDALMNFGRTTVQSYFDQHFQYANPVNGLACETTLDDLRNRSIIELGQLLVRFQPLIDSKSISVNDCLGIERGRSLSSGLYRTTKNEMKHFSLHPVPLPGF